MARKTTKSPDKDEARTTDQGTPQEQQPAIPKAKHLGGNTYILPGGVSTTRKPIPKKHRKIKTS
jgi:hypothetical protein